MERPESAGSNDAQPPIRLRSPSIRQKPELLRRVSTLPTGERASARLLRATPAEVRQLALAYQAPNAVGNGSSVTGLWTGDRTSASDCGKASAGRYVCFSVLAHPPRGGQVLVSGKWDALGAWDETHAVELLQEQGGQGKWVSLCVRTPDGPNAWPLEYHYLLRPCMQSGSWTHGPCIWEAPNDSLPRKVSISPGVGRVLRLDDTFGEQPLELSPRQVELSSVLLHKFLEERLRLNPPRPGSPERPYQFCTKDLLLTFLLYWPSRAPQLDGKVVSETVHAGTEAVPKRASAKIQPVSRDPLQMPMLLHLHGYFCREPWRCVMPGLPPKVLDKSPLHGGSPTLRNEICICTPVAPHEYYWMRAEPQPLSGGLSGEWRFEDEYKPLIALALHALVVWLQLVLPIDPERTYLSGDSMGGYGAWEFARLHSELFAAMAVTCGHYEPCPVGRLARLVCALRDAQLPVWVFHACDDDVCSFEEANELVQLLCRQFQAPPRDPAPLGKPSPEVLLTTEGISGHDAWSVGYSADSNLFAWLLSKYRVDRQAALPGTTEDKSLDLRRAAKVEGAGIVLNSRKSLVFGCLRCFRVKRRTPVDKE